MSLGTFELSILVDLHPESTRSVTARFPRWGKRFPGFSLPSGIVFPLNIVSSRLDIPQSYRVQNSGDGGGRPFSAFIPPK